MNTKAYEDMAERIGVKYGKFSDEMDEFNSLIIDYTIKNKDKIERDFKEEAGVKIKLPSITTGFSGSQQATVRFQAEGEIYRARIGNIYSFEITTDDERLWELVEIFTDVLMEGFEKFLGNRAEDIKLMKEDLDI